MHVEKQKKRNIKVNFMLEMLLEDLKQKKRNLKVIFTWDPCCLFIVVSTKSFFLLYLPAEINFLAYHFVL